MNKIVVFGDPTSGTASFASPLWSDVGRGQAIAAARRANIPWATAWWRPRRDHIAAMWVENGEERHWYTGSLGQLHLCSEAADYLSSL